MEDEERLRYQEEIDDEAQESGEAEVPQLTLFQAFGLVLLFVFLHAWIEFFWEKGGLKTTLWFELVIKNGVAGVLAIWAGLILSGLTTDDLFERANPHYAGIIGAIALGLGLSVIGLIFANFIKNLTEVPKEYLELLGKFYSENLAGVLLAVSIVAPVTEEALFRGAMHDGLSTKYKTSTVVVYCSFLFALIHFLPWLILNAFILGLILAGVKHYTGSLVYCITIHGFYNALPFLLRHASANKMIPFSMDELIKRPVVFGAAGLMLILAGAAALSFSKKEIIRTESADPAAENIL